MATLIADQKDIGFVLHEQFEIEKLLKEDKYQDLNPKMVDMIIKEARSFGIKEILPTFETGDREGVSFENGKVSAPQCYRRPYDLIVENQWTSLSEDPQSGGQGLPHIVARAANEYLIGANYAMVIYALEGHGTAKMIDLFGTEQQRRLFCKKLYTGQWGGTMDLTEPQAGSDVGAITTAAVKQPDGTYSITGNKIFITNGEHDLADNIIHPVLARVEGAPEGTGGISIFIVPKIWVAKDGSLAEPNDIVCTGVEEKLGLHGSATCSMAMGSKGVCRGLLLGQENQGMHIMFHMMNEARLDVGFMGFCHASAAYLHALNYAKERLQGRELGQPKGSPPAAVPIIRHPDVKRMLLWMKAHVSGMRSFTYYVSLLFDKMACAADPEDKSRHDKQIALLTPLIKAYCAQRGFEVCSQALQVHGGYGYTMEYPVEQHLRDCKIATIFEGTDGIQAMDLMGRKLPLDGGAVFQQFIADINATVDKAGEIEALADMANKVGAVAARLNDAAHFLIREAASPRFKVAYAHAWPFLMAMGDVVMAWMLLWRATVAVPKVDGSRKAAFYDGQIKTAQYFIDSVIPVTIGQLAAIRVADDSVVTIEEASF
jgi:alkylation response protein AidB-like acyl-CoA dehydrogenase